MRAERALADRFAALVLERAGHPPAAPVDTHALAAAFGVPLRSTTDMRYDGRTVHTVSGPLIEVNSKRPLNRQRFVTLHELAHCLVRMPLPLTSALRAKFKAEEELCDVIAAALLMPRRWVADRYPDAGRPDHQTLRYLTDFAAAAAASREAAIIRLRDLFDWNAVLFRWERRIGPTRITWRFDGEYGVRPWERGRMVPAGNVADDLLTASRFPGEILPASLELRRSPRDWPAEVVFEDGWAYALVQLDAAAALPAPVAWEKALADLRWGAFA